MSKNVLNLNRCGRRRWKRTELSLSSSPFWHSVCRCRCKRTSATFEEHHRRVSDKEIDMEWNGSGKGRGEGHREEFLIFLTLVSFVTFLYRVRDKLMHQILCRMHGEFRTGNLTLPFWRGGPQSLYQSNNSHGKKSSN